MSVEIKRVFYSYNSECNEPYTLGVFAYADGRKLIDFNETYTNWDEFKSKISEIVPLLEEPSEDIL